MLDHNITDSSLRTQNNSNIFLVKEKLDSLKRGKS